MIGWIVKAADSGLRVCSWTANGKELLPALGSQLCNLFLCSSVKQEN